MVATFVHRCSTEYGGDHLVVGLEVLAPRRWRRVVLPVVLVFVALGALHVFFAEFVRQDTTLPIGVSTFGVYLAWSIEELLV